MKHSTRIVVGLFLLVAAPAALWRLDDNALLTRLVVSPQ
jgi:hypothetical protein